MRPMFFLLPLLFFVPHSAIFAEIQFSKDELKGLKSEEVASETVQEDATSRTLTTPSGLNFRVAKDRPLEKVASYIGPIGLDSYIYQKSEELKNFTDVRFSRLEYRFSEMSREISELKTIVKTLESRKLVVTSEQG